MSPEGQDTGVKLHTHMTRVQEHAEPGILSREAYGVHTGLPLPDANA